MKSFILFCLISFLISFKGLSTPEPRNKINEIKCNILEEAEIAARIGATIGIFPGAFVGALSGSTIGFIIATPCAAISSFVVPVSLICSGNFLSAPLMTVIAPAYTLALGTAGGLYLGGIVSGAVGLISGSCLGAICGLTKATALQLPGLPKIIGDEIFGEQSNRKITLNVDKIHQKILAELEYKAIDENRTLHCSICSEIIDQKTRSYTFRHCQCEDKGLCEECKIYFLNYYSTSFKFPIECPGGCRFPVTEVDFERLTNNDHNYMKRFKINSLKSLVCNQNKFRFCPTEECINGKFVTNKKDSLWQCEVCNFSGCILCSKKNVSGSHDCDDLSTEIDKILDKGKMKPDQLDPSLGTIRPCFFCGKLINRIDGCNSVRCTDCGRIFHWNKGNLVRHDFDKEEMQYEPLQKPHF